MKESSRPCHCRVEPDPQIVVGNRTGRIPAGHASFGWLGGPSIWTYWQGSRQFDVSGVGRPTNFSESVTGGLSWQRGRGLTSSIPERRVTGTPAVREHGPTPLSTSAAVPADGLPAILQHRQSTGFQCTRKGPTSWARMPTPHTATSRWPF
jgi:hypothetical protein